MSSPSTKGPSPPARRVPTKPRITINIPPQHGHAANSPYLNTAHSNSTVPPGAPQWPLYENPFTGGKMYKQIEGFWDFTTASAKSGLGFGEKSALYLYQKFSKWSKQWFTHVFLFLCMFLYCLAGAYIFIAVEAPHQQQGFDDFRATKANFSTSLHTLADQHKHDPGNFKLWDEDFQKHMTIFLQSVKTLYEENHVDMSQTSDSTRWNNTWSAMFYCGTVFTTIGYGHLTPKTDPGKMITIIYAIIGIPMFLILLADFGKLFTRGIKFMWAYVRRLYYTGSCRKVRKQAQVQDVLRGMNMAYEIATFRRPSMMMKSPDVEEGKEDNQSHLTPPLSQESPITPMPMDVNDIDDEFNLPISLALFLLLAYILIGAAAYTFWEEWEFFESSYFVFISMSTIGFGDSVPDDPAFMMASILYLIFGLALTSMCINVVQLKLSDSFRHATAKISATIGLSLAAEEVESQCDASSENRDDTPSVHSGSLKLNTPTVVVDEPPPELPKKSDTLAVDDDDKTKKKSKK